MSFSVMQCPTNTHRNGLPRAVRKTSGRIWDSGMRRDVVGGGETITSEESLSLEAIIEASQG